MSLISDSLRTRLITAFVLIPIVLLLVWVPVAKIGFIVFVVLMATIASFEYFRIAQIMQIAVPPLAGMTATLMVTVSAAWGDLTLVNTALVIAILLVATVSVLRGSLSLAVIVTTVFGIVYVGWFAAHMILLHDTGAQGPGLVMILIVAIVFTDAGAYFVGKAIGAHKLAPAISPNKTWEGAIGGFVLTIAVVAAIGWCAHHWQWSAFPSWSVMKYAVVAVLISISAQVGDLLESSIKRNAGIKDSGNSFPGHGGALDRFDGFLFAAPVLYYIAAL